MKKNNFKVKHYIFGIVGGVILYFVFTFVYIFISIFSQMAREAGSFVGQGQVKLLGLKITDFTVDQSGSVRVEGVDPISRIIILIITIIISFLIVYLFARKNKKK